MGKYSRDLDESLAQKVKEIASSLGLKEMGINVEAVRMKKSKTSIGEIVKAPDLVKLFLDDDSIVVIALYEDAFDLVDDATKNIWIESLLTQVFADSETGKITVTKPEIQIPLPLLHKYKDVAAQKMELAYYTIKQIEDKKREEKEAKKEANKNKKQKNS